MSRFFGRFFLTLATAVLPAAWANAQAAPAAPATPPEIQAGIDKLKAGKIDEAVKDFEEAARRHPEISPAQVIMYNYFRQANDPNKARLALEKAVLASPADPEAYVIMGNIALQERRVTEAELLFGKSKELLANFSGSPQRKKILDPLTLSGLASVEEMRDKWPLAEKQLKDLLAIEPKNAMVMQRLARAMFSQRRPKDALDMLTKAKAADPANVLAPEAALAGFYEQYPDHQNAIVWFDKALAAYPNDLTTHRVVGIWALETGDLAKAKAQAEICYRLDSRSLDAMLLRGVVALYDEDYAKAEEWFQMAHLQSPGNFAASNNLALALCEQNDPAKTQRAIEYANNNYTSNQKSPDACSTLGWVLFKKPDIDSAYLALRQAVQLGGGNLSSDTAYYLAAVLNARNQKDDARTVLEQILKTDKPFSKRKAAKALLEKLPPATTASSTPAGSGAPAATGTGAH